MVKPSAKLLPPAAPAAAGAVVPPVAPLGCAAEEPELPAGAAVLGRDAEEPAVEVVVVVLAG